MAYSSSQSQPRNWRKGFWNAVVYAMLIAGSLMFLLPLVFALTSSFKTNGQIMEIPPRWIPDPFHWQNYPEALTYIPFAKYTLNTLIIAVGAITGNLLSCTIIAYGFARLKAPGRISFLS